MEWSQHYNQEKRYTLDMVRIDDRIRQVINHIKQAEAKEAHLVNRVNDAAPDVSVAT